jgi:hypothetical protein
VGEAKVQDYKFAVEIAIRHFFSRIAVDKRKWAADFGFAIGRVLALG